MIDSYNLLINHLALLCLPPIGSGDILFFPAGFIGVREMSGKLKRIQGQGIVREFYVVSVKKRYLLKCQGIL